MAVETLASHPSFLVGALDSLLVVSINSASSIDETLDSVERTYEAMQRAHQKVTTLTILVARDALTPPPSEMRERAAAMAKRNEPTARGSATLVLMRGLSGVVARTFLSAFFMLNRAQMPQAVLSTYDEAASWVRGLPGQTPALVGSDDLAAQLEHFVRAAAAT